MGASHRFPHRFKYDANMSATTRNATWHTLIYAAIAAVLVGGAVLAEWLTRPVPLAGFEQVGEEFYPDFDDPMAAAALRVAAYDEAGGRPRMFTVEQQDGQWRIPSHHNYPAEAKKRLAETAASLVGLVREAMASRRGEDHPRLGVVDPLESDADVSYGWGKRVTLFDPAGDVLVDYIVGNQVPDQENVYYIRRADETETFRTEFDVSISAKFSDWIEPDLLQAGGARFVELVTKKYGFREIKQEIAPGRFIVSSARDPEQDEINRLTRDETGPWKLAGLDESAGELNSSKVFDLTSALEGLRIVGVRKKPAYNGQPILTSDFRLNPPADPEGRIPQDYVDAVNRLGGELNDRGFRLVRTGEDEQGLPVFELFAGNGELTAATDEGVVYHLYFGEAVLGDETAIEIGAPSSSEKKETETEKGEIQPSGDQASGGRQARGDEHESGPSKPDDSKKDEPADPAKKQDDSSVQKNRYLYVRVEFDAKHLGEAPEPPIASGNPPLQAPRPNEYKRDFEDYKSQLEDYEKKLKEGRQKVERLNDRFADWYYVISSDSFDDLRPTRADLLQSKTDDDEQMEKKLQPALQPSARSGSAEAPRP